MTTADDTTTDTEIRALRSEAKEAGDTEQVVLCDIALGECPTDSHGRRLVTGYAMSRHLSVATLSRLERISAEEARAACEGAISYARGEAE